MVGINRLPPTGGPSGLGGMASPENNRPQTPPPTSPAKALTDPNSMSSFLSGPMSSWLVQNSSAYSPSDLSDLQRQISDTAASLQNSSTSITENLSQFNDLMGQLGFPLGDADMAQQMQTAASSLDSSAQKQLSSYTSQVSSISTKVHAASGSSANANEILEQMEETSQQLTSLASGISSAAMATEQLSDALQSEAPGASLSDVSSTFSSVTSQSDAFNAQAKSALAALPSQLAKIQASLKTLQTSEVQSSSSSPCPEVYNAVEELWCLYMSQGAGNPNLQATPMNYALLAQAVNDFMSAYTTDYPSGSTAPSYVQQIYTDLTTTFSSTGGLTLAQLCAQSSTNPNPVNNLFDNSALVNNILTNGSGIQGSSGLWADMNAFYSSYSSNGYVAPPATSNSNVNDDITQLMDSVSEGNMSDIAAAINALSSDLKNAAPLDGYLNFLKTMLSAPLDSGGDTLASISGTNPPNIAMLQSYLGSSSQYSPSSLYSFFSNNPGNNDGESGSVLYIIYFWETNTGQGI